jgi:hypothetical protein
MNDEIEAMALKQLEQGLAIADVDIMVSETAGDLAQTRKVPERVTTRPKELAPEIVVDAVDGSATAVVVLNRLRTNQAAAAGDKNASH